MTVAAPELLMRGWMTSPVASVTMRSTVMRPNTPVATFANTSPAPCGPPLTAPARSAFTEMPAVIDSPAPSVEFSVASSCSM